jgi:hypothetical protein
MVSSIVKSVLGAPRPIRSVRSLFMRTTGTSSNKSAEPSTSRAFDAKRLDVVWAALAHDVRESISAKAKWERAPRAAVIHNWWPDVWAQIAVPGS